MNHTITDRHEFRPTIEQVRADGYALVDQELESVRSIVAPIRNERDDVIAAINVSCHAFRVTVERMGKEVRPQLLNAATEISMMVGVLPGN